MLDRLVDLASKIVSPITGTVGALGAPRLGRRVWSRDDRTHIEVRGLHRPGAEDIARELERRLLALTGVRRAEVNAVLGRVVVTHDPAVTRAAELERVVAELERDNDLHKAGTAPGSRTHPGNSAAGVREITALGINLAGLGYAASTRLLPIPGVPSVVSTTMSLIDNTPMVRHAVNGLVGKPAADAAFALSAGTFAALSRRPIGLLTNLGYRYCLLREIDARRRAWESWESSLAGRPGAHQVDPLPHPPRPARLRGGPVEHLSHTSATLAMAGYGAVLGLTRSPGRAAAAMQSGVPRPAKVGREAFAAQLDTDLSAAGALVLQQDALRRLDRVDTVVLDAPALLTGARTVEDVAVTGDRVDPAELFQQAHDLIDVRHPEARRARGDWGVAPLAAFRDGLPAEVRRMARKRAGMGARVVVLLHRNRPVGLASVLPELHPLADALVESAHRAGTVVLAGVRSRLDRRLPVDQVVPGGNRLLDSVRTLQAEGRVVALVAARSCAALDAADVGIGLPGAHGAVPWGAHVVCSGPAQVCSLLAATDNAAQASRYGAQLSAAGSGLATLLTSFGPALTAHRRASFPVTAATLMSLAVGTWAGMEPARRPMAVPVERTAWHAMSPQSVLTRLESSPDGLSTDEAELRQRRLPADYDGRVQVGLARAFVDELANPITPTLAAGAGVSASLGSVTDPLMILGVLGLNALIGAGQQLAANRELRRLTDTSALHVRLRRDGATDTAPAGELVPGDIVELIAGDAVPADCRLLVAEGLEVDESTLTGESQLVAKSVDATIAAELADRNSMLYDGTAIAAGRAIAVVVATGNRTELGRTTRMNSDAKTVTGVEARLMSITRKTIPVCVGAGAALMAADLLRLRGVSQALDRAVSLSVAAVPEGLPFVATVAELAAARRLSDRGVLARKPATIEALGRVDVLCFDKTGTLTEGRISLRQVSDGITRHDVTELTGAERRIVAAGARASPWRDDDSVPHLTDRAVLDGARELGIGPDDGMPGLRWVDELTFEPSRGYHAVLGWCPDGYRISVKGAPEAVLTRCVRWRGRDDGPFDADAQARVADEVERLARHGYRVLAVAERAASDRRELDESRIRGLDFVGLLALSDPVRPTAATAVDQLRRAGVEIVMITGDHPSTAEAIASELSVLNGRRVLTGAEMDAMDDEQLTADLPKIGVFARVTPSQKARIVRQLRHSGRVVAMTGDGANDVPAIKLAHVGIALGTKATPAAREAADLVVTDDRIETITAGIVEGRAMWASVRDALSILLGGNLGEIAYTLGTGLLSSTGGLNVRQLMLVNLLTDVLPAMAVAVRPPPQVTPEELLAEGPEASLGVSLTRDVYARAATTASAAGAGWLLARPFGTAAQTSTTGLVSLVGAQLCQTMAVRGRTPLVLAAGLGSLVALGTIVQVPGLSQFFGCQPLLPHQWAIGFGASIAATTAQLLLQPWIRSGPARHPESPDDH